MSEPVLLARVSEGVIRAQVEPYPPRLWTRAKARKERRCCLCKRVIQPGELSWRELSNALHRADRVCARCW